MNKIADLVNKHFYNGFLAFLIVLNILPFLAPIFAHIGLELPAKIIYTIYSVFCHQFHWRSIHLFDYQVAWCARDTFIWFAMLSVAILVKRYNIKPIKWYWLIPTTIPVALDGGIQTIATLLGYSSADPIYMSTNLLRMITGSIFGLGLAFWMLPMMFEIVQEEMTSKAINKLKARKEIKVWKLFPAILVILFVIYIILVQLWRITSSEVMPSNFLDSQVKTPVEKIEWFERGKNTV